MKDIEKITCSNIFKNYIYKSIPLAFDESMSYYETLCNVLALLKKHEEIINNNADVLKELENYVVHYFDNLDVQEEINNKLDEMAEDGTLENLISQYVLLQTTFVYNNINEMKNATNLTNGSFARTSGFYKYDDKGGAFYKVRNVTNEDIIDNITIIALNDVNLVAELIPPQIIRPEIFGAYGDGIHDDTSSFNLMINYTFNLNNTNEWEKTPSMLCENTYNIQEITIPTGMQQVSIDGNNTGKIINEGFTFPSNTGWHTTFKNLMFSECDKPINFEYYNVEYGKIYIQNCSFINCTGTTLNIQRRSHQVYIENNRFVNCEKTAFIHDVDMCYIKGNWIETNLTWSDNHYDIEQYADTEGSMFISDNLFVPGKQQNASNCAWIKIGRNANIENNRFSGEFDGVHPIYINYDNFDNFTTNDFMYPIVNFINNPIVASTGSILINKMCGQLNIHNNSFVKSKPCIEVVNDTIFNNLDFNKLYISLSNNISKIFNYRNYGWKNLVTDNVAPIIPLCLQKFIKKNNLYALNKNLNYETNVNNKTLKIKLNTKSIIDSKDIQFLIYGIVSPNPNGSPAYFENFTALLTLKRDYFYDTGISIFPEIKLLTDNNYYHFSLTPLINNVEKIATQADTLPDDIELSVVFSNEFNNSTVFFKGFLPLEFIPIQNDNVFYGNDWATNN